MFFFLLNVCRFVELKVDKNNNGLYFGFFLLFSLHLTFFFGYLETKGWIF